MLAGTGARDGYTFREESEVAYRTPAPAVQEENRSELSETLTPSDCNLRSYEWMRSDVANILDGDLSRLPDDAFRGAVMALHVAWHQVPAASLPDDDATLAGLLRYGRDVAAWRRAREAGALDGWIKCRDGRLYHPDLAEQANEAWRQRQVYRGRAAKGAAARWERAGASRADDEPQPNSAPSSPDHASIMLQASCKDARGDERKKEKREEALPSGQGSRARPMRGTRLPEDWTPDDPGYEGATARTLDAFRDYWRATPDPNGRKADWQATWRNWCRRENQGSPQGGRGGDRRGRGAWLTDETAGRPGKPGKLAALYAAHGAPPTVNGTATADDDGAF